MIPKATSQIQYSAGEQGVSDRFLVTLLGIRKSHSGVFGFGPIVFGMQVERTSSSLSRYFVSRRYSAFLKLHRALRSSLPNLPQMPPKSIFRKRFWPAFMEEREKCLSELLGYIMRADPTASHPALQVFLGLEADTPERMSTLADLVGHDAVIMEITEDEKSTCLETISCSVISEGEEDEDEEELPW